MKSLLLTLLIAVSVQAAPAPDDVVRQLYAHIVADHPLGLPEGKTKAALDPLLTPHLAKILEDARACEADYVRTHTNKDEKPEYWWLEAGLFSGENEMALPSKVEVLSTEPAENGRSRVTVRFTYAETFETYGRQPDPAASFQWRGAVLVECHEDLCLIDDFIPFDTDGHPLDPLSRSFASCKGPKWIGQ